jgi:putative transposase
MPTHLRRYDVPGHAHFWTISCFRRLTFFWHDKMKDVVIEALHSMQTHFGVCLTGYVIMPEHVHFIVYPHARGSETPVPISELLHAFKRHTGYHGKRVLRDIWRRDGSLWSPPLNDWAHGELDKQVIFETRGYDFNIDRHQTLLEKLDYCHKNPVTRGLVDRPEEWAWSSFRFYELEDRSVLAMDWDGSWPILW